MLLQFVKAKRTVVVTSNGLQIHNPKLSTYCCLRNCFLQSSHALHIIVLSVLSSNSLTSTAVSAVLAAWWTAVVSASFSEHCSTLWQYQPNSCCRNALYLFFYNNHSQPFGECRNDLVETQHIFQPWVSSSLIYSAFLSVLFGSCDSLWIYSKLS